jgi:NhaP-type Na+/H+ or K+/H+ antiporter
MADGPVPEPVVIVGAGPVGMSAALALRARGVPVTILEAEAADRQRPGSRADYVHGATLEILESIHPGLGMRIVEAGVNPPVRRTLWGGREVSVQEFDVSRKPGELPHSSRIPQTEVEAFLLDAVAARDVQIRHAGDREDLRFGLTCEAGINDGSAFPVIMLGLGLLGLHELGGGWRWALVDVAWASMAGVVVGVGCGWLLAKLVSELHRRSDELEVMDNFLGLGLIAVVYGASILIHAYGFLAVFAAAVALRHTEVRMARQSLVDAGGERGDEVDETRSDGKDLSTAGVTDRSLFFKEQLEHFSEIVLILIIGGTLFLNSWTWPAVGLAIFVFLVARPVGVWLVSLGSGTPMGNRWMTAWFGIRGIGSLYYLMYAIEHGLPEELGLQLIQLVLIVVTLSILFHGVSVKPLMAWYTRQSGEADGGTQESSPKVS